MPKVTFKIETVIPNERVSDMFCNAFEGGSNYWVGRGVKILNNAPGAEFASDVVALGGRIAVYEDAERKWHEIDAEHVRKGLQAMQDKYPRHFGDMMSENDDSTTGDVFLQCCLFGEVIYG